MRCRNAFAFVAVVLSSCAEPDRLMGPDGRSMDATLDQVARAFALGMSHRDVRAAVRDAMRASPLTEHKLSLQAFANSRAGERLIGAAAPPAGLASSDLRARIAALPDIDFYVPARQQRLTWTGTTDYVIATSLHGRAPTYGYDANGGRIAIDLSTGDVRGIVIIMLQAAEPKSPRIGQQPDLPGSTIQEFLDGELSGSWTVADAKGGTRTYFLADLDAAALTAIGLAQCYENCGGGGGGGGNPPPATYLERIATQGICDNSNCSEGNEFEFRAMTPGGTTNAIRIEGVGSTVDLYLHRLLIYALPPMWVGGEGGAIAARETDNFGDDYFFFTDLGYCGAVVLDDIDDKLVWWYLTEGTCDVFAYKGLAVMYTW